MLREELPIWANCREIAMLGSRERPSLPAEEYLIDPDTLIDLPGKGLQKKRSQLRQFLESCPGWQADVITKLNIDTAYVMERQWQRRQGDAAELSFVRECFRNYFALGLHGVLLTDGFRPVGYSISALCGQEGAFILVMRLPAATAGAATMLYRETARALKAEQPALRWINMGFSGGAEERKLRLSYSPTQDKASLRRQHRLRRKVIAAAERCVWDSSVAMRLFAMPQYIAADTMLCYLSSPLEVSTAAPVAHGDCSGKQVGVPRWAAGQMEFCRFTDYRRMLRDSMGLLQPPDSDPPVTYGSNTICIVPALAVDRNGYRLGYGGGYYDRFLAGFCGTTVTLAYDDDIVERLPVQSHDLPVDYIVTPTQVIETTYQKEK